MRIRSRRDVINAVVIMTGACTGLALLVTFLLFRDGDLQRHMVIAAVLSVAISLPNALIAARRLLANHRRLTQLEYLAHTDTLTGLSNRRHFLSEFSGQAGRARAGIVLMIDIDNFKEVNDTHGHMAGDDVLRAVARALRSLISDVDHICRFGGEEFVVFLRDHSPAGGLDLAHRVREAVEQTIVASRVAQMAVTVSVGCSFKGLAEDVEEALLRADAALYDAKQSGRNLVTANWS